MNIFLAAGRVGPAGAGAGIARLRGAISQSILENARESHSEFEASYSSRPRESSSESCRSSSAWELSAWDGMQEGLTERIRRSSPGLRAAARVASCTSCTAWETSERPRPSQAPRYASIVSGLGDSRDTKENGLGFLPGRGNVELVAD